MKYITETKQTVLEVGDRVTILARPTIKGVIEKIVYTEAEVPYYRINRLDIGFSYYTQNEIEYYEPFCTLMGCTWQNYADATWKQPTK